MPGVPHIEIGPENIDIRGNLEIDMFYVLIAICALAATIFICRYFAAKTLMVEKDIEKAIAQKFASSSKAIELANLREENAVMRNLLLDLLENEAVLPVHQASISRDDLVRMKTTKIQRYREILAESHHVLKRREVAAVAEPFNSSFKAERRL